MKKGQFIPRTTTTNVTNYSTVSTGYLVGVIILIIILVGIFSIILTIITAKDRNDILNNQDEINELNDTINMLQSEIDELNARLNNISFGGPFIPVAEKGVPFGVTPLNGTGVVARAFLKDYLFALGEWNALTNTPTLISSDCDEGDFLWVSVAGNTVLDGESTWLVGDLVICFDGIWNRVATGNIGTAVLTVNGQPGPNVILFLDDIADVDAPSPNLNDVLLWDGFNWVNAAIIGTVISVNGQSGVVNLALDDLTDVISAGASPGDLLGWSGTFWVSFAPATYSTIVANQLNIASGSFVPVVTIIDSGSVDVNGVLVYIFNYMRIGNIVTVSGDIRVNLDLTATVLGWDIFFQFPVPILPAAPFGTTDDIVGPAQFAKYAVGSGAVIFDTVGIAASVISISGTNNARYTVSMDGSSTILGDDWLVSATFKYRIV